MEITHSLKILLLTVAINPAAHALDLVEALTLAQQNDATIDSAYAGYLAAIEGQDQSTAALYPQIFVDVFTRETTTEIEDSSSALLNNSKNDFVYVKVCCSFVIIYGRSSVPKQLGRP